MDKTKKLKENCSDCIYNGGACYGQDGELCKLTGTITIETNPAPCKMFFPFSKAVSILEDQRCHI